MTPMDHDKIAASVPQKGFFGHPRGLFTLFFTEFWERFSYYGMKAILVYYMYYSVSKGGLGIDQSTALAITSIYGSLVYMSGIIGGWVADRILGSTRTVFYGGILIMFGHIVLALPGTFTAFLVSMVLIVLGTGLLKPNISNIVGDLYTEKDERRDSGFSIFYMGINMGAFLSPLVVGTVGEMYSFHLGFGLAAIGMLLGLIVFAATKKKNLGQAGSFVPNPLTPSERKKTFTQIGIGTAIVLIIGFVLAQQGILTIDLFILIVSILGILIPATYFIVMYNSKKTTAVEKSRLLAYIPLFIAAMVFWAIQEQGSTILAAYAAERTALNIGGFELKASWFQSLNPLFIITLAPLFAWMWIKLGDRQPSTSKKFSFGLIFAGLSFIVMIFPASINGTESLVNPLWLVLSFFLVVIGELCLSPVGLSATTKLAPSAFSSQTMSLWFLTSAAAQAMNAQVVRLYKPETEVVYFGIIGGLAIVLGLILFMVSPAIQRLMKGVR
ncbi:peptide MFS transporter [Metabacillus sp. KIGAM252]|uniref:Peptide MFS transporter n=1 Tax=Metabacillus flavus TaxID=2823519 RepID=A0ABS5LHK2_9BACI|nr:peptide MFS transporter [Metabacillus flavus]MBS2970235.1 peptide MFS transporter [Metabacillus flavus]